jgi:hypothetical protein
MGQNIFCQHIWCFAGLCWLLHTKPPEATNHALSIACAHRDPCSKVGLVCGHARAICEITE